MKIKLSRREHRYMLVVSILLVTAALIAALSLGGIIGPYKFRTYYDLTITSTAGGSVTPGVGTHTYPAGTVVKVVATPDGGCKPWGYQFVKWTGCRPTFGRVGTIGGVTAAKITITMNNNYCIMANFIAVPRHGTSPSSYNLTINRTDGGNVTKPGEGTFPYVAGAVVNLVATPDPGYQFVGWSGTAGTFGNPTAAVTNFTMPAQEVMVTANFGPPEFYRGSGTEGDPYQIADWYHLDNVRNYLDSYFILVNDLNSTTPGYEDLASSAANGGHGWDPIGVAYGTTFTGNFDGQGYEIKDLFINRPGENGTALFCGVGVGGVIENAEVVAANVVGGSGVGILVGASYGNVSHSSATGDVTGVGLCIGGLVGWNDGGIVDSSHATVSVTGSDGSTNVGGLVGGNAGTVSSSYATGSVIGSGNSTNVGGLVGGNAGTVSSSYATGSVIGSGGSVNQYGGVSEFGNVGGLVGGNGGNVSNSYATGSVTGNTLVGGLVGGNSGPGGHVSNSHATGSVTGSSNSTEVGGLVGGSNGTVSSSYATGVVTGHRLVGGLVGCNIVGTVDSSYATGNVTGNGDCAGGLVGDNENATVRNSYATGSVTGNTLVGGLVGQNLNPSATVNYSYSIGSVTGNTLAGGLVGNNYFGTVSNSFWDTQTSGQTTSAGAGATGKTTVQMKAFATFSGAEWNIVAVANPSTRNPSYSWNIVDGQAYPFLSWQPV